MFLSSADSMGGAHVNWYLMHVPVVYPKAEQSLMAEARIRAASDGGILLCANCTRCC